MMPPVRARQWRYLRSITPVEYTVAVFVTGILCFILGRVS